MKWRSARVVVVFGLGTALTGCATTSPLAARTAAFSTAANATIHQTENAYQLVDQAYADAQVATLVVTFDSTPFDPKKLHPYLPEKDLAVRTEVLDGLSQYATLLAEVSGNQPIKDLEDQAEATGKELQTLDTNALKSFKNFPTISPEEQGAAETAVVALGSVLIERERARALPAILEKMNTPIQKICTLLESDIGTPGKPGLASALHDDYGQQIAAQQRFIRANAGKLSPEEKRLEIEALPKLVTAQQRSDQALAATVKALQSLAAAHAALAATTKDKDAPAFAMELDGLVENARTLSGFYASLNSNASLNPK